MLEILFPIIPSFEYLLTPFKVDTSLFFQQIANF
jgi:hypothetical protein